MPLPRVPLHRFRPRLAEALAGYRRQHFLADLGAGITVGIVALPLAMAFAIASGVKPEQGLATAIVGGLLISALGGSNVQIGGPAGAFIVIVYGIVERHGVANLLTATLMAGAMLVLMGWLRLGVLVRYIPVSIVIGFTNGIAVLIALSQLKDLLGLSIGKLPADFFGQLAALVGHIGTFNPWALALGLASLGVVAAWPRAGGASAWQQGMARVPGTLVALALATVAARVFELPVDTIGSRFGAIPQSLPRPALPSTDWATLQQLLMPAFTIALLGAVESLLCARIADNLRAGPRHDPNQELMAQGMANIAAPLFGGIPATGTIARTVTNVRAGAASPIAGVVHALTLLLVMFAAAPLAAYVPLAALAGILLFVAWNMGEWREFARLRHFLLPYRTVLLTTFVLTVVVDLSVAVEVGLLAACGFFVYRMSSLFRITEQPASEDSPGEQSFELYGALFFGAVGKLEDLAQRLRPGVHTVVLDMHQLISLDTSGLDALVHLHQQLAQRGIRMVLCAVNEQPLGLIHRGGLALRLGPDGLMAGPR